MEIALPTNSVTNRLYANCGGNGLYANCGGNPDPNHTVYPHNTCTRCR